MKIEESIIINRRPEEVFAFLEVRSNDATWMGAVVESDWLDGTTDVPAPIGVGRRGRMLLKLPGAAQSKSYVVMEEIKETLALPTDALP